MAGTWLGLNLRGTKSLLFRSRWEPGAASVRPRPRAKGPPGPALGQAPEAADAPPDLEPPRGRVQAERSSQRASDGAGARARPDCPAPALLFPKSLCDAVAPSSVSGRPEELAAGVPARPRHHARRAAGFHTASCQLFALGGHVRFDRLGVSWISLAQTPQQSPTNGEQLGHCLLHEALLGFPWSRSLQGLARHCPRCSPATLITVPPTAHPSFQPHWTTGWQRTHDPGRDLGP